jgi:hypothetical protein
MLGWPNMPGIPLNLSVGLWFSGMTSFMANVWVSCNDPLHTKYTKYKWEYIPKEVSMENIC